MKHLLVQTGMAALVVLLWVIPPASGQDLSQSVAVIVRSLGDFGEGADYDIEIHADGRVIWSGKSNVNATGTRNARIDSATVGKLFQTFFGKSDQEICFQGGGVDGPLYMVLFSRTGEPEKLRAESTRLFRLSDTIAGVQFPCTIDDKFDEVITGLERAVNSHRWMHGQESILDERKFDEDIEIGTKLGFTSLMRAAGNNDVKTVAILANNQTIDATDQTGWTPLMIAARSCSELVVETLLSAGAKPAAQDKNGDTALMAAAAANCSNASERSKARLNLTKRLIKAGGSVNHADQSGTTALMVAAEFCNPESAGALLGAGAQTSIRDREGHNAKDYAMKFARQLQRQPESRREEYGKRLRETLALLQ